MVLGVFWRILRVRGVTEIPVGKSTTQNTCCSVTLNIANSIMSEWVTGTVFYGSCNFKWAIRCKQFKQELKFFIGSCLSIRVRQGALYAMARSGREVNVCSKAWNGSASPHYNIVPVLGFVINSDKTFITTLQTCHVTGTFSILPGTARDL